MRDVCLRVNCLIRVQSTKLTAVSGENYGAIEKPTDCGMNSVNRSPVLELDKVTRTFPGVVALSEVSFDLLPGEVHALVGENGAGKSTLINLVSGVLHPDGGFIRLNGQRVGITDPVAARKKGIITVHQEADFFPTLSVAENMALLHGLPTNRWSLVDWRSIYVAAQRSMDAMREAIDIEAPASRLRVAQRHMAQIASADLENAKVVILDEPTSALTTVEAEWLFEQIACLKQNGSGIIYISHRQEDIFAIADRITVLRDGHRIWTRSRNEVTSESMIEAMVGRELEKVRRRGVAVGNRENSHPRLKISNLNDRRKRFSNINLEVHAGEILGIYGLIGAGRTELAHTVFGIRKVSSGTIEVDGKPRRVRKPQDALLAGIAYLPEDRLQQGICRGLSVRANAVLTTLAQLTLHPQKESEKEPPKTKRSSRFNLSRLLQKNFLGMFANRKAEQKAAGQVASQLQVRHRSLEQPISQLSGGNQQKIVIGRWLLADPKVLILDEPTRGVDVGAKAEIHRILRSITERGCAVVMISSELPEVLNYSDRILVMRNGQIAASFSGEDTSAAEVATAALPTDGCTSPRVVKEIDRSAIQRWFTERTTTVKNLQLPRGEIGLLVMVLILGIWLGLTSDGFFHPANIAQLLADTALWVILGLAATTVIITGGIDISVGSLLALSAAGAGLVLKLPLSPTVTIPLAIFVALSVGISGGLINGAISLIGRVHPIVVTLGMMIIYRGVVIGLLRGHQISYLPQAFGNLVVHPESGFRGSIVFGGLVAVGMHVVFVHTRMGRHFFALGASPTAARTVGISKPKTWLWAFGLSGLLVGLAGLMELSASMNMQSQLAKGWELQAIAVAVIGGVSIIGGRGNVLGVVLSALLLRLVNSALVRWQIQGDQVDVVVGGMILAAVLFDLAWRRRER